jgi:23S rRNA (adenine2030-N6)-methyltransferase
VLSYRHAYHAGNHADVLKHLTLIALLRHFNGKESPYSYLDSHSGKGYYDLADAMARKTAEHTSGVDALWQTVWDEPILQTYCDLLRNANAGENGRLRRYLGSPAIARELSREEDRLILMELHNREFDLLKDNFRGEPRAHLHHRDGFEGLPAIVPPTPRRGLALIDPAYEVKTDYEAVIACVQKMYRRWQTGVVAVWFPLLGEARDRSEWLKARFREMGLPRILLAELKIMGQDPSQGMHGSAMVIINTPWQLDTALQTSLSLASEKLPVQCADPLSVRWLT